MLPLLACAPSPPPEQRGTLVIAAPSAPKDLLPVVSQSTQDSLVIDAIHTAPYDPAFDCSLEYSPRLATGWAFDGDTLDVTLRADLKWQDGTPVTAHDLAFAYELAADPAVASPRADHARHARPFARDDTHLRWTFDGPADTATLLSHTSIPPAPRHLLASVPRDALRAHAQNAALPIASGPWKVGAREWNQRLVLEPNEHAPPDLRPRLDRVVIRTVPEYASRLLELETGGADLMEGLLPADAARLAREHPEIRLYRRGWRTVDSIAWNTADPRFADRAVRRALTAAIDADALIRDLLGEYGRPAVGTLSPALCGLHHDAIVRIPHDPAAARAALAAAGWADRDGDAILDRDGRPFRFDLLLNTGNERRARAAVLVQAALRDVGVDAQLETMDAAALTDRLKRHDFDAALTGWGASLTGDLARNWAADSPFNYSGYRGADDLLASGDLLAMQARIYDDQPHTFLYWMDEIVAVHGRFAGVRVDLVGAWRDLHRWYVQK